jgi:hypothetical protein
LATREIAAIIGLSARATRTRLARLIDRGLVREIGTSAKDPQRKYVLAELIAQCDPKAPPPADLALWDSAKPVGQEVW